MADIDVEELLRQGGRHDDGGDLSVDDLVAQGGKVEEAPGALRTFGRSFRQGVNPLWDEGAGFMGANLDAGKRFLETGDVTSPGEWLEGYRRNRDDSRDTDARGAQANPTAATTGRVTGAVVQGLASGGAGGVGRGLVSAVTSGATQGAVNALASSEADLTRLKAEEYARAATDTLGGSVAGAAGGAAGYGVGKGLAYVGGKARDAYRGARGALEGEARAGLEAEEAALRAADEAADVRMGREQGRALEMNKAADSRSAREEARRVAQEARAAARAQRPAAGPRASPAPGEAAPSGQYPGRRRFVGDPNADPDTNVLKGYEGGAHRRRVDNAPKVRDARAQLARPDITPAERAELEAYVGRHGDAVDNPPAFRLRIIEDELVRRGYSPEVVRRAMARFDAEGRAVSRGARPHEQPLLPERTQVPEPADVVRQGRAEEAIQQGGGGPSAFGQHFADAKTRVDPSMQPDPFHDAPTKIALMERAPQGRSKWEFEFRDPKDGREYVVKLSPSEDNPRQIVLDIVRPKDMTTPEALISTGWNAAKNRVGPGTMKQLYAELARKFPDAEGIFAYRATGWNAGRDMEIRLPEVTEAGAAPYAAGGQRRLRSDEGHGPYKGWPEHEKTAADAMPRGEYELPGEPTQSLDMGDVVRQGRVDAGGGGSAFGDSFAEAPTRVDPAMQNGVQRFDVLGARPTPRAGQPYTEYGTPRRAALPPEDVAAAEEAMAARRAAAFGSRPDGPAPEPTAGARPRAMTPEQSASMRAPEDGPIPPEVTDTGTAPRFEATFAEGTRATRVPEVRRAPMRPEATTVQPPPEATQVGGPSAFTDRTRYAPPDMAQRLAGRPSVDSLVDERIAGGRQALRGAFMRGATGESGALAGVAGLALGGPAGGLKALALRGGLEVVREALRNPAAKARAIEAFKLQRLATIRPEVWGRVSATLQRAAQRDEEAGTDYHARAARHALLQTDPAFRAAEAEAAKELQGLSEDELARRLAQ